MVKTPDFKKCTAGAGARGISLRRNDSSGERLRRHSRLHLENGRVLTDDLNPVDFVTTRHATRQTPTTERIKEDGAKWAKCA